MTVLAPAAMAFAISPEKRIPPSAMIGTPYFAAPLAASATAESWGIPIPAMMRVVQILPGPTPTLMASAPARARAMAASSVAILPTITSIFGKAALICFKVSITPFECPCAVSMLTTSTPALMSAATLASMSGVTPTAAPTIRRPKLSLAALGLSFFLIISR